MTTEPRAPDWYPDPSGKPGLMYWDGQQWHTSIPAMPTPITEAAPEAQRRSRTKIALILGAVVVLAVAMLVAVPVIVQKVWNTAPPSPGLSADVLAPFAREWKGMRESVVIDRTGHGHFHYMNMKACASCSMAEMPYSTFEFTLTSVSSGTASGHITASSDPHFPVGEPVAATLASQDTIEWAIGGKKVGLFCGSNPAWCGG
ncbi:DUF2510 domain-containing protein [Mycobacterium noviomagense]|uniref:DUF2510 domain-containing protein n=1 Tax=Mycobacterium noviomagense TaxID=459858 RepID=A0A7I7P8X8_9MYCO|nr:DUF2510 domain-containing protein [Mycobacterium noviomagense]ORB11500.1 hypothetical protein BST37_19175 [Mycobacterium noviomagense]BBY05032.1 hypothetical protein MNVI_03500 [Mycobacterium noviomagense]